MQWMSLDWSRCRRPIPVITLLGLMLPDLIGGSFIFETIFAYPGMGRLGYDAISAWLKEAPPQFTTSSLPILTISPRRAPALPRCSTMSPSLAIPDRPRTL